MIEIIENDINELAQININHNMEMYHHRFFLWIVHRLNNRNTTQKRNERIMLNVTHSTQRSADISFKISGANIIKKHIIHAINRPNPNNEIGHLGNCFICIYYK